MWSSDLTTTSGLFSFYFLFPVCYLQCWLRPITGSPQSVGWLLAADGALSFLVDNEVRTRKTLIKIKPQLIP